MRALIEYKSYLEPVFNPLRADSADFLKQLVQDDLNYLMEKISKINDRIAEIQKTIKLTLK